MKDFERRPFDYLAHPSEPAFTTKAHLMTKLTLDLASRKRLKKQVFTTPKDHSHLHTPRLIVVGG